MHELLGIHELLGMVGRLLDIEKGVRWI